MYDDIDLRQIFLVALLGGFIIAFAMVGIGYALFRSNEYESKSIMKYEKRLYINEKNKVDTLYIYKFE